MKDMENLIKVIRLSSIKLLNGPDSTPSGIKTTITLRRTIEMFLSLVPTNVITPDEHWRTKLEWVIWNNTIRGADSSTQFIRDMGSGLEYVVGRIFLSLDRKSTRLNSSHSGESRMPSSA